MKNISFILSLLGLYLIDKQPVIAVLPKYYEMTWTNSLKNESEVTKYLASEDEMASEVLSLSAETPPVVKMGPNGAGAFTLDACLKQVKVGRKKKELFLEVPTLSIFKAAVVVLRDKSNGNAIDWVFLSMRVVKGPNGKEPGITQKEILDANVVDIRKSIGLTIGEGPKKGFTADMYQKIIAGWEGWDINNERDMCFLIDIFHVSHTNAEALKSLDEALSLQPRRVYYLNQAKQNRVRMQAFRRHVGNDFKWTYFNAPEEFMDRFWAEDPSEPTDEPESSTPAGSEKVVPLGIIVVLAITVML